MGSYYSILSNDSDSNGQIHLHFHIAQKKMADWFKLLHGPISTVETEVNRNEFFS